jgi:hypothetical protein
MKLFVENFNAMLKSQQQELPIAREVRKRKMTTSNNGEIIPSPSSNDENAPVAKLRKLTNGSDIGDYDDVRY